MATIDFAQHRLGTKRTAKADPADLCPTAQRAARSALYTLTKYELMALDIIARKAADGRSTTAKALADKMGVRTDQADALLGRLGLAAAVFRDHRQDTYPEAGFLPSGFADQ